MNWQTYSSTYRLFGWRNEMERPYIGLDYGIHCTFFTCFAKDLVNSHNSVLLIAVIEGPYKSIEWREYAIVILGKNGSFSETWNDRDWLRVFTNSALIVFSWDRQMALVIWMKSTLWTWRVLIWLYCGMKGLPANVGYEHGLFCSE